MSSPTYTNFPELESLVKKGLQNSNQVKIPISSEARTEQQILAEKEKIKIYLIGEGYEVSSSSRIVNPHGFGLTLEYELIVKRHSG